MHNASFEKKGFQNAAHFFKEKIAGIERGCLLPNGGIGSL
jgi:hypothetical protein